MPTTTLSPVETVQSLYAAFGRGDIPTILAALHPQVDWRINADLDSPGARKVPTLRPCRGPQEVVGFFTTLASELEIHSFQPVAFATGGNEVAARIMSDATVRATGKRLKIESAHWWTFDSAGKVTRFVDFYDTLAEANAWGVVRAT